MWFWNFRHMIHCLSIQEKSLYLIVFLTESIHPPLFSLSLPIICFGFFILHVYIDLLLPINKYFRVDERFHTFTREKSSSNHPANVYLFKVNNRNTRKRCEICSKLTIKTTERSHWRRSGVFIVNFEHIAHFFLMFLLLNLSKQMLAGHILKWSE